MHVQIIKLAVLSRLQKPIFVMPYCFNTCHASLVCASCHVWLFIGCCFLLWVAPGDESEYEEPVEFVHEEQSYNPSEESSGKMIITLDTITIFTC
jgi:hypothetical protein